VTSLTWRKSSRSSDGTTSTCIEVAQLSDVIGVRDSKNPDGGHVALTSKEFATLVRRIKEGA
jgi:hypothetical protein